MKALILEAVGGPDNLRLAEEPDPTPGNGELLVRVRAATGGVGVAAGN